MANTINDNLTNGEINFMEYWKTNVIPNKTRVTSGMLDKASTFLNFQRSGNCTTCMKNDAITLNNKYRSLLNAYTEYLDKKKEEINYWKSFKKEVDETREDFNEDIEKVESKISTSTTTKKKRKRTTTKK